MSSRKYIIYALVDPFTNEMRYIGKSSSGLLRPRKHWNPRDMDKDKNTYKVNWIKKLKAQGEVPKVWVLEKHTTHEELCEAEIDLIAYYRSIGCRLTNIRRGGDGITPEEARELWQQRTPEFKEAVKQRMLAGAIKSQVRQRNNLKLRRPIVATNIATGEERWYLSSCHAAADGISSRSAIANCLRPAWRCPTNKGWQFRYVNK